MVGSINKRKVHIDKKVYGYKIGLSFINIWTPIGTRLNINMSEFLDVPWTDIERTQWKSYWYITPADIRENIIRLRL